MAKKKTTLKKKKTTKKKAAKKATKRKTTKKKSVKKKTTKKKAAKKKATKKKATKKAVKKKTTGKKVAKKTTKLKLTKKPSPSGVYVSRVRVGQVVPTFSAEATGPKVVKLSDLASKRIVLFFYPKDSTPGCTIEGHDFTRLKSQFNSKNTEVYGISRDSMKSHENFKSKQNYSIDLISDSEEELCKIFGVIKMKNMYGKQVRGIERSTFVIDEKGVLVREWRGVKVPGHAEEVLNFVQSLG